MIDIFPKSISYNLGKRIDLTIVINLVVCEWDYMSGLYCATILLVFTKNEILLRSFDIDVIVSSDSALIPITLQCLRH